MSNTTDTAAPPAALPFAYGDFTVPAECRRIFITAELEPSNSGALIQPTGFPDLGPVLYSDPAEKHGLICLIESEAKMANWLEEMCLNNEYEGTLRNELAGLPYIKLTRDGKADGEFVTASTIDGHRFASEYVMSAHMPSISTSPGLEAAQASTEMTEAEGSARPTKGSRKKAASAAANSEFVSFVRQFLGMTSEDKCPAANVPRIHLLAMEYDPMALLHGFQISVKKKLTFVGLRSQRAITASIVGLGCERVTVPGVRFDPIGTASAAQAIFQKPRITAKKIEARFCIDVGLLASLYLGTGEQAAARLQLLLKIALCKIAWFLQHLHDGLRLRTDCNLRLVSGETKYWLNRIEGDGAEFNYMALTNAAKGGLGAADTALGFSSSNSPLVLQYVIPKTKEDVRTSDRSGGQLEEEDGLEGEESA